MAYRIIGADFSDFIAKPAGNQPLADQDAISRFDYQTPKGDIRFKGQALSERLAIVEGTYRMHDEVTIAGKGETGLLEIQINLSDADIHFQDKAKVANVTPAQSANIAFLSADENEANILFRKDVVYHTFDIHLPATLLDRYAGESNMLDGFLARMHRDESCKLSAHHIGITPAIHNVIQDIRGCAFEGLTRRIFLESKAYELIALLYESAENRRDAYPLTPADQERIHVAAELIRQNVEQPLTIHQLAREVGINQTKLKMGFKAVFGNTVFGYLQDIRMHQAKRCLLDTRLSVQEIGMLVGYQSTSNFSAAFKKTFGYPPGKLRAPAAR